MKIRRAWLHRRGRKTWMFESEKDCGVMKHFTSKGNCYVILRDDYKPFWIGKVLDTTGSIITVERELRAFSIEFENGGEYRFN